MAIRSIVGLLIIVGVPGVPVDVRAQSGQRPSFLQAGEVFCTDQADFDSYASRHGPRQNPGRETCTLIATPTRAAVMQADPGHKSMVRITAGPYAYVIGWTNGTLP